MLVAEYDYDTDIAVQREESLRIGIQQGIEQGIEEGIEQGIQQGFSDGSYQTKLETAKLMKGMNYPINDICTISGLSVEEIKAL